MADTDDECRYTAYEVDASTDFGDADRTKIAEYRVPAGEAGPDQKHNRHRENVGSSWF